MKILGPGGNPGQLRPVVIYSPQYSPAAMPLVFVAETENEALVLQEVASALGRILGNKIRFDDYRGNPQVGKILTSFGELHLSITACP